jgi:Uma2 family endonuclease
MQRWAAEDVLLVIEVSDETVQYDLGRKAEMYAEAGYPVYWVVTEEGVHVHTEPTRTGYVSRVLYRPGQQVPVPYVDGVTLDVGRLIGA